ncbi:MAG: glycoside hydrolase family 3 C-terminal domain-containing protein [Atopobiaceae bacterium]|jgi:beta-glucosidase|nr:glycoside hydrolase family 3 C-terminal domain-containing protein [Atopobiaceae bacterium]MCI2173824.1 glycoside hydrolase family 3 C-terminal domain-containing protein [Atopobiaceae bacterium]MCI2207534.1 glycoside hydrolase family 3 C-terminal domain-containing protein [Atopobiaceae bacterium]
MSHNVSRRGFVAGSAAVAGLALMGTAACGTGSGSTSTTGAPDKSKYPIDPDGSDVKAKWTSEEVRDGWTKVTNPDDGAELGVMDTAKIIQVDGLAFKDMNGDGKLELFEDWRQSSADRAAALAESLSADDLFPLLWAGGTQSSTTSTDTSATEYVDAGSRAGVSRLASSLDSYATDVQWINGIQEICEKSALGIPYLNYSDPYVLFDVPTSNGLAACMDKDIWRKAGMWQARAWRATGVRCELGPQVDVYSNPIGTRLSGSVSEDPAVNRDFAKAFGGGMQSTWGDDDATDDKGWGSDSVGVMLKHFVGEGSNEGGRDDHSDSGKWNVFPGNNFNAHLVPFLDGGMNLDSSTKEVASMMPCYGIAYDPNEDDLGEHVGSAYSKHNMSILRNAGWDGMLCTDWMILTAIAHGVTNLTETERYAKLMENGISQHGGSFDPDVAKDAYTQISSDLGEDEALKLYQENARRIFKLMADVELFENPYSDRTVAKEVLESEKAAAFGLDASEKCVIMLKNDGTIAKGALADKPKVYIPQKYTAASKSTFGSTPASIALSFGDEISKDYFDVVTDTVADPTGAPADGETDPTAQDTDITRLTAADLADVKYAVVGINNPADAYQGVEGGPTFATAIMGMPADPGPYWKPISLQYRPFTADGDYVRRQSLNPVDENGVLENRSVFGASTYATNESDLDLVINTKALLPADAKLIVVIDADRPMCFGELEQYADVILMGFNTLTEEAFAHIITGDVEPSGLLPFQMPKDMETVFTQDEDVPRDMECYTDSAGNVYDFCFGLNWSGVISDDRTKTYKVDPLTKPEATVKADA